MASNVGNIRIEPVDASWEIEEQSTLTLVSQASGSYDGTYLTLGTGVLNDNVATHYLWFDQATISADPAPAGLTGIEVDVALLDSAATIATATAAAVTAITGFEASASGAVVTITCSDAGDAATLTDVDTTLAVLQCQEGGLLDVGFIEGDVESAFEIQLSEVTAHQTGTTLLADLRQGSSADIAITFKETDAAKLKEIFVASNGGTHTPSGGTELWGWGVNRQGSNTVIQARRLRLHPVALADSDHTRDLVFWKAFPLPDTLVYSGENPQTLTVTFKTYLDASKPDEIQHFAYGDWDQLVPVVP